MLFSLIYKKFILNLIWSFRLNGSWVLELDSEIDIEDNLKVYLNETRYIKYNFRQISK